MFDLFLSHNMHCLMLSLSKSAGRWHDEMRNGQSLEFYMPSTDSFFRDSVPESLIGCFFQMKTGVSEVHCARVQMLDGVSH